MLYKSDDFITDSKYRELKYIKNTSSFWRNIFSIVINFFKNKHYKKKEKNLLYRFSMAINTEIKKGSEAHNLFKDLIEARRVRRISNLEVVHSFFRMIMLWKDLKYPR